MSIKSRLDRLEQKTGKDYFCEWSRMIVVYSADDVKMREGNKGYRRFMELGKEKQNQILDRLFEKEGGCIIVSVEMEGLNMGSRLIRWHEIEPMYSLLEERDTTTE